MDDESGCGEWTTNQDVGNGVQGGLGEELRAQRFGLSWRRRAAIAERGIGWMMKGVWFHAASVQQNGAWAAAFEKQILEEGMWV